MKKKKKDKRIINEYKKIKKYRKMIKFVYQNKPKGTGETVVGTGAANATITSSGAHDLILDTNSGSNSGTVTITDGANADMTVAPNGYGRFTVDGQGKIESVAEKFGNRIEWDFKNFFLFIK